MRAASTLDAELSEVVLRRRQASAFSHEKDPKPKVAKVHDAGLPRRQNPREEPGALAAPAAIVPRRPQRQEHGRRPSRAPKARARDPKMMSSISSYQSARQPSSPTTYSASSTSRPQPPETKRGPGLAGASRFHTACMSPGASNSLPSVCD
jgi:hypothetical protein